MKIAQTFFSHPLVSGGMLLLTGTLLGYSLHFFFTIIMGRMLSVEDFGLFSSLISFITFFTMIQLAVGNLFSRFSAQFHALESYNMQKTLLKKGFSYALLIVLLLLLLFFLNQSLLMNIFKMENPLPLLITEFTIVLTVFFAVPYGILQGMLRFTFITFLNLLTAVVKIIIGLLLVYVGFGLSGALGGVLMSILIPCLIASLFVLNFVKNKQSKGSNNNAKSGNYKTFSIQFLSATAAITILSHGDIVFARFFLSPVESGQYAALSLMGKTIYYVTQPIHTVFFPLISYQSAKKDNITSTLKIALLVIISISIFSSMFYFLFPSLVQNIFFPAKSYQVLRPLLGPFSLYIVLLSTIYIFHNFFLSLGRSAVYKINLVGVISFLLLGSFFHSGIVSIMMVLSISAGIVLTLYLVYYILIFKNE